MSEALCDFCKTPKAVPEGCDQSFNCPDCGLLCLNPDRKKRTASDFGVGNVVGDSDKWNPWVPGLTPLDPPRMKDWEERGLVRRNPATGQREGYCPTRAEYNRRVKELGFTTDWNGQQPRENRRESREEWRPVDKPSGKSFFI